MKFEKSQLKKLKKSELIKLLLKQNVKTNPKIIIVDEVSTPQSIKPIPKPRKSVKQMVVEYEDNIILPPTEFRDGYKPVPKPTPAPRTKKLVIEKPVPIPRT